MLLFGAHDWVALGGGLWPEKGMCSFLLGANIHPLFQILPSCLEMASISVIDSLPNCCSAARSGLEILSPHKSQSPVVGQGRPAGPREGLWAALQPWGAFDLGIKRSTVFTLAGPLCLQ